jgi:hypothetical protein
MIFVIVSRPLTMVISVSNLKIDYGSWGQYNSTEFISSYLKIKPNFTKTESQGLKPFILHKNDKKLLLSLPFPQKK